MTITTLDNIRPGQDGVIRTVGRQGVLRRRLLDTGLTPCTSVYVNKVAPMDNPMELDLRGYILMLHLEDAAKIEVDTKGAK